MDTNYTLSPHVPVVTYATTYSLHKAISAREIDPMGHAALPANGHAADQSAGVIVPPLRRVSTPLLGAVKGYVAGSRVL